MNEQAKPFVAELHTEGYVVYGPTMRKFTENKEEIQALVQAILEEENQSREPECHLGKEDVFHIQVYSKWIRGVPMPRRDDRRSWDEMFAEQTYVAYINQHGKPFRAIAGQSGSYVVPAVVAGGQPAFGCKFGDYQLTVSVDGGVVTRNTHVVAMIPDLRNLPKQPK